MREEGRAVDMDPAAERPGRLMALRQFVSTIRAIDPALMVAAVCVVAFCFAVARHAFPLGVPGQWTWDYRSNVAPLITGVAPVFVFVGLATVCFFFGERADLGTLKPPVRWLGLLLCVLIAFGLRCSLQSLSLPGEPAPDDPAMVVISPVATSYFTESMKIDQLPDGVREFMRDFPTRMLRFSHHAQTHPPGTILFFWCVRKMCALPGVSDLLTRSDWSNVVNTQRYTQTLWRFPLPASEAAAAKVVAFLMPALGALFLLPVFALSRHFWGESYAWRMLLIAATVPGLLVFFPTVDQVYVTMSAMAIWMFVRGVDLRKRHSFFWSGLWLGIGLMMTLAFLSLIAIVGWMALLVYLSRRSASHGPSAMRLRMDRSWRDEAPNVLLFLIGLALPIIAGYAFLNIDFFAVMKTGLTAHGRVTTEVTTEAFPRTYWKWIFVNLLDFGGALGVAWIVRMAFAVARLRNYRGERDGTSHLPQGLSTAASLGLAWLFALLLLDVSGVVRAEVARIWMFLFPVGVVWCGPLLRRELTERMQSEDETGRQNVMARVRMNVEYAVFAGLQLLQAVILQREVVFMHFW